MNGRTFTIVSISEQNNLEYTYTVNLGGSLIQQENWHDPDHIDTYILGSHQGYDGLTEIFEHGDSVFCSHPRRATVIYSFGPTTTILSATEPSQCVYRFEVQIDEALCAELGNPIFVTTWSISVSPYIF